ncbi:MAG: alpha/beta hydrolase [Bacteroidales bacterium]|nr:alpha/beta hydrolase [Candidatus Cryptobacteroides equifaecalis]
MRKTLIWTTSVLAVILVLLFAAGWYMTDFSLKPKLKAKTDAEYVKKMDKIYPGLGNWIDSLRTAGVLRDTTIVNHAGRTLRAFYATADNAAGTVVLSHGYTDGAIGMMMLGREYRDRLNFNIMLPDHEYHGLSVGPAVNMGWKDRINLERWIDIADAKWPGKAIILHGISMGAATVMMCSGDPLPESVHGIVEDCGYTSVWDEFAGQLKEQFGLPTFPILNTSSFVCRLRYGWGFKEASALKQVEKSTLPMLFIHGDQDTFVPFPMVYQLYDAKKQGAKTLYVSEGSVHARSYLNKPEEYMEQVENFVLPLVGE